MVEQFKEELKSYDANYTKYLIENVEAIQLRAEQKDLQIIKLKDKIRYLYEALAAT